MATRRIIVGISGASGTPLAIRLLRELSDMRDVETYLVATQGARVTASYESDIPFERIEQLADHVYGEHDIDAPIASGTFAADGMVVVPCSMKTVAGIACGFADNLLLRAADVCIKEQRRLVLMAREAPLSAIHLRNLSTVAALPGVMVCPPVLSYYHNPHSLDDVERHIVGKALGLLGLGAPGLRRWRGPGEAPNGANAGQRGRA